MRRPNAMGVGFTDLLFNALLGFVVMFILAFLLINPVAKKAMPPKFLGGAVPDVRGKDRRVIWAAMTERNDSSEDRRLLRFRQ